MIRRSAPLPPSRSRRLAAVIVGLACAAPVPGDIGSCGQPVDALSATTFFRAKRNLDCRQCLACGIRSPLCDTACSGDPPVEPAFPDDCYPLVHDGEVCLRRLLDADCNGYSRFMSEPPTTPTECDFCPR